MKSYRQRIWVAVLTAASIFGSFSFAGAEAVYTSSRAAVSQLAAEVRDLGWICYAARSESGDWDLHLCRPDGSGRRNLTNTPELSEFAPQFSRDRGKLLYRRVPRDEIFDDNRHGEQGELVIANADGSAPVVLGRPGELPWASFSPDGTQIASLSIKGIAFFDLGKRQILRSLPRKGFFQQVTWSPDGQWIVGVANAFGTGWSVARMRVETGAMNAVNRVNCCTPDWFPNSQDVVFSWRPPGQQANNGYGWTQLWRASANGASRRLLYAEDGRHVYGGHVSPDGRYVLFTGNKEEDGDPGRAGAPMALMRISDAPIIGGEHSDLRALHPEAKNGPVLTLPIGWEPCWTDLQLFVGSSIPTETGSLVTTTELPNDPPTLEKAYDSAAAERARLADELRPQGWLVFSARTEAGDWDLFIMRPDGSDRRPITLTPVWNEAGPRWSKDGRWLLYYRLPHTEPVDNNSYGMFELVVAEADGARPVVFGAGFPWASWGPDSDHIACLAPSGIRIFNVSTRTCVRELPRRGVVSQLVWSPDGTRFAGTANGLGPFWNVGCLNANTGAIEAVSETDRYNCTPDWLPDSGAILYARGIVPEQPGHAELWVAGVDRHQRQRLYAECDRHIYGACASPDGRFVIFTRSHADLGQIGDIEMAIIRWPGGSEDNAPQVRLDLGPGWEPHWTGTARVP